MEVGIEPQMVILGQVALAAGLGAVIGIERELAGKAAGVRTHMLVTAGAALLMALGDTIVHAYADARFEQTVMADPVRIMHGIIVGISFLGAGTIITNDAKQKVEGLTTAAGIWLVTALGVTVGMGLYLLAASVTAAILLILVGVRLVEALLGIKQPKSWRGMTSDEEQSS